MPALPAKARTTASLPIRFNRSSRKIIGRGRFQALPRQIPAPLLAHRRHRSGRRRRRPPPPRGRKPATRESAIASFKAKVGGAENNTGDIHAKNPRSSASGNAQFTDGTFRDYYRKVYGQDPGKHPARELKDNPESKRNLLDALTRDNAAHSSASASRSTRAISTSCTFRLGRRSRRSSKPIPDADRADPLGEGRNRSQSVPRGKSASEVIAWAHKKMGRSRGVGPVAIGRRRARRRNRRSDGGAAARRGAPTRRTGCGLTRAPDGSLGQSLHNRRAFPRARSASMPSGSSSRAAAMSSASPIGSKASTNGITASPGASRFGRTKAASSGSPTATNATALLAGSRRHREPISRWTQ
jgi:hypothetical protein